MIRSAGFRNSGQYQVKCDSCSSDQILFAYTWQELMAQMKKDGFKMKNNKGRWEHECGVCVKKKLSP